MHVGKQHWNPQLISFLSRPHYLLYQYKEKIYQTIVEKHAMLARSLRDETKNKTPTLGIISYTKYKHVQNLLLLPHPKHVKTQVSIFSLQA
jgi:hypothetical protein